MQKLYSHDIRNLPKVELHRHLDCSVRWSTVLELAPLVGIEMAGQANDPQAQKEQFLITGQMKDLDSVLKKFLNTQKILASEEILRRIAYEAVEDAFNDGVRLLELRYAPTFIHEGHDNLNYEKIHRALYEGMEMAKKKWPIAAGLICIIQRVKSTADAEKVTDFAIDHRDTFLGLDLADNEDGFDPKTFASFFQRAKKAGLRITVHSGESPSHEAARWVRDSVEILGAERIGHGVQIIRDPSVLEFIRDRKIPLEICPISNWLTQAFPTHEAHPIRRLMEAGIRVTVNSDDPGIFHTALSDDYEVLHRVHGFTREEFARLNRTAYEVSFLPESEKQRVWSQP